MAFPLVFGAAAERTENGHDPTGRLFNAGREAESASFAKPPGVASRSCRTESVHTRPNSVLAQVANRNFGAQFAFVSFLNDDTEPGMQMVRFIGQKSASRTPIPPIPFWSVT
jgi:hypothetical protein